MSTLKLRKIGNSYGVILPKEVISRLKVEEGDSVYITESHDGYNISSFDPDFEETMKAFEAVSYTHLTLPTIYSV